MWRRPSIPIVLYVLLGAAAAQAHPLAPSLLDLQSAGDGVYTVLWKTPARGGAARPEPILPARCRDLQPPTQTVEGTARATRWSIHCGAKGLAGERITIAGLDARGAPAVVRIRSGEGSAIQTVVDAAAPSLTVPESASRLSVYLALGFEHLVLGFDHVLFVLGLLLLVRGRRALLATVTAFTLGHSVTLSLVVLGFSQGSSTWVEVGIAATLVALAAELVPGEGRLRLFGRRPWRAALLFGLLHGMGFAGALSQIGLPPAEVPFALLSFNVGIELGQLVIVLAAVGVAAVLRIPPGRRALRLAGAYAIGCASVFWLFERTAAALAP